MNYLIAFTLFMTSLVALAQDPIGQKVRAVGRISDIETPASSQYPAKYCIPNDWYKQTHRREFETDDRNTSLNQLIGCNKVLRIMMLGDQLSEAEMEKQIKQIHEPLWLNVLYDRGYKNWRMQSKVLGDWRSCMTWPNDKEKCGYEILLFFRSGTGAKEMLDLLMMRIKGINPNAEVQFLDVHFEPWMSTFRKDDVLCRREACQINVKSSAPDPVLGSDIIQRAIELGDLGKVLRGGDCSKIHDVFTRALPKGTSLSPTYRQWYLDPTAHKATITSKVRVSIAGIGSQGIKILADTGLGSVVADPWFTNLGFSSAEFGVGTGGCK